MNGRIVAINDSIHEQVQKLLPWFVVDTLTGQELELVNQHLNVCAECQEDFAWQCKMQATPPAGAADLDADRAFAKLRQRLDETPDRAGRRPPASSDGLFGLGNHPWMQWALAAQLFVIAGLAVLLATPYGNVAAYRALGASQDTRGNMVVVFRPETPERELRRILQDAGARIVDGPTVTDAYLLSVPGEKFTGALHDLRANAAVVVAESLRSTDRK
jgi:hypothetical protein